MLKSGLVVVIAFAVATIVGCGGNSEKDLNPNPNMDFSKDSAPKRGGGMPGVSPKGAKMTPDATK